MFLKMMAILFTLSLPISTTIGEIPISVTQFFSAFALIIIFLYYSLRDNSVYLVDFTCYQPADSLRLPSSFALEHLEISDAFDRASIDFLKKVQERSGIGDESCVPVNMHELPPDVSFKRSQEETEEVMFTIVKDLLAKQNINPKSIDILVTNCTLFCPTPSLSAMIVNKFGFRSNIKSISLSGMGCSAGILSISLVKDLLKVHKNSLALVLSMEALSLNGYKGSTKSMLIANVIFRMGGAAILLSNRQQDKHAAKYKLKHVIRTHTGQDDRSYSSIFQQPDKDGSVGVSISRALIPVAAYTLKTHISELGPLVLPYSEQLKYGWKVICQNTAGQTQIYLPNFKKAFEHFCIHAGGRSIIDAMEDNLKLQKEDAEASRMTLYRFGNTSSSSYWYELCYLEAKGKVRKGDRIWQIAFGSGFKTNSAVWKCVSNLDPKERNAWSDRIHLYPMDIANIPSTLKN